MWFLITLACSSAQPEPAVAAPAAPVAVAPAAQGHRSDTDVDGLVAALSSGGKVIDVRTPEEFAAGHVPGAVNLPLGSFGPEDAALASYDKEAPLYVICQSGGRSSRAADQLAAGGFQTVNVKGGTAAWLAAGRPVER